MPAPSSDQPQSNTVLRVADMRQKGDTPFTLTPDDDARKALAAQIGASAIRKLRFEGRLSPQGARGWLLQADLGATVVQPCVITLEPVTTRIDAAVERRFVPQAELDRHLENGAETEMPEDDTIEPLGAVIDLAQVMTEALSLALPAYPRKDDAALDQTAFAADGVTPLDDDAVKPFAGLAALRDKLQNED